MSRARVGKAGRVRRGARAVSVLAVLLAACGGDEGTSHGRPAPTEPGPGAEAPGSSDEAESASVPSAPPRDGVGPEPPEPPAVGAAPPEAAADGLPRDVPRPAGATAVETHTFANGDRLVGYEADEPPGAVFARLREDLESRGWILEHVLDGEVQKILRASKDGYRVIALVVPQADVTRIALRSVKIEE